MKQTQYDVIIVGGGTAGCVLASRLSEDASRSVLLLEAGKSYPPEGYPEDLTNARSLGIEPTHTWGYQAVPGTAAHSIAAYAGRVLGGGSTINAGIARRARPDDFARWERHVLPDWTYADALPFYKFLENTPTGKDLWHGRKGPWPIRQATLDELTPVVRAYVDGASSLGMPRVQDFNAAHDGGTGPEVKNVVDGQRCNTGSYSVTYLVKPSAGSEPPDGSGVVWVRSSEADDGELDLQHSISVQPDFDQHGRRVRLLRIWATVVLPKSVGTVRLKSRDPQVTPRIDYNLLADDADRQRLLEVVKLARTIAGTEPLASMLERELLPGPEVDTDAALEAAIRAGLMTFYHRTSTVPMGSDTDSGAVVDALGRVHHVNGLRVIDASIFPEAISTPTNLTTLMVAERIASSYSKP